jgi:hypothetical protein
VDAVALHADRVDAERDGAVAHVRHHVHAALVEPLAHGVHADVGLVLVVGRDDLDADGRVGGGELLRRLPHAGDAGGAGDVAVRAGEVGQHADADDVARGLGPQEGGRCERQRGGAAEQGAAGRRHGRYLPWFASRRHATSA